jgi:hypothetical protein
LRFIGLKAVVIACSVLPGIGFALANPLPQPTGAILLTVEGAIANSNQGEGKAVLDLAMLESLPVREIQTTTPWTDGPQIFTGVALSDLLDHVGATGDRVQALASNQYEVIFPASDVTDHGGIVAYRQNGAALAADKGPLWIVFDYDSNALLLSDRFQSASIWNLVLLRIQ